MFNIQIRVHTLYLRPLSVRAQYSNLCPTNICSRCHGSLRHLNGRTGDPTKFKPLIFNFHFPVQVILRPMVRRPARLGVVPLLERVTRCYISLSDNYFLSFSRRAPSLTRGQVCNLQCNDTSSSYIAMVCWPVCLGARPPVGPMTRF
jgi:hypothetical protein